MQMDKAANLREVWERKATRPALTPRSSRSTT